MATNREVVQFNFRLICVRLSHQPDDDILDGAVPLSYQRVSLWLQQELVPGDGPQLKQTKKQHYVEKGGFIWFNRNNSNFRQVRLNFAGNKI